MLVNQLSHVLVACADQGVDTLFRSLTRQCTYNVVSLYTFFNNYRQPHGSNNLVQRCDLRSQFLWHRWAIGFVIRVNIIAKGFAFGIKYHTNVGGLILFDQAFQHVDHAIDGSGILPLGIGKWGHAVESTK